jgi:hypothetical protein
VPNLLEAGDAIGRDLILEMRPAGEGKRRPWAALHDPERYNIVLVEAAEDSASAQSAKRRK